MQLGQLTPHYKKKCMQWASLMYYYYYLSLFFHSYYTVKVTLECEDEETLNEAHSELLSLLPQGESNLFCLLTSLDPNLKK